MKIMKKYLMLLFLGITCAAGYSQDNADLSRLSEVCDSLVKIEKRISDKKAKLDSLNVKLEELKKDWLAVCERVIQNPNRKPEDVEFLFTATSKDLYGKDLSERLRLLRKYPDAIPAMIKFEDYEEQMDEDMIDDEPEIDPSPEEDSDSEEEITPDPAGYNDPVVSPQGEGNRKGNNKNGKQKGSLDDEGSKGDIGNKANLENQIKGLVNKGKPGHSGR